MVNKTKPRVRYYPPFWEINEVPYRDKIITCRVFEKLTPAMNIEKLAEFYEKEKQAGNPYPTDSILTFTLFSRAETDDLKNFFRKKVENWINTTSITSYIPLKENAKDKIIHNYQTSDEYIFNKKVAGPDGWFSEIPDKSVLKPFLGTSSVKNINKVCQDINGGRDGFIFRLNKKPEQKTKRGVGFLATSGGLDLLALRYLSNEHPAFRVLRIE